MLFEGAHGQVNRAQMRQWIAGLAVAGSVVACKPTAIIAQQQTTLATLVSSGALGDQCTETSPDARPVLRFTMTDTNNDAILPGSRLNKETVVLGTNFTPDDLLVAGNTGTLFPAPDVECPGLTPTTTAPNTPCPDATLAAAGFVCQPIAAAVANDPQGRVVCALPDFPVEISPNASIDFVGGDVEAKAVIVLVANGSSVLGFDTAGRPSRVECSSDPDRRRTNGVSQLLRSLNEASNPFSADTDVCIASFLGGSEPDYYFPAGEDVSDCFQSILPRSATSDGPRGFDFLDLSANDISNRATSGGRNPWAAIKDAVVRFDEWASPEQERHIVMFTDGPPSPETRATEVSFARTYEDIEREVLANEVHVHIVQLDRRDRGADCDPATEHGALEEYARLACVSGGNFSYVESAADVPVAIERMGLSVPGHYEMEMLVDDSIATLPLGPYKLDLAVAVDVLGNADTLSFSAVETSSSGRVDNRIALMNRGVCASGTCLAGYECTEDSATCQPPLAEAAE